MTLAALAQPMKSGPCRREGEGKWRREGKLMQGVEAVHAGGGKEERREEKRASWDMRGLNNLGK